MDQASGEIMRTATCACGSMAITLRGEPLTVSMCFCTRCQRRTGSFVGYSAIYDRAQLVALPPADGAFHLPDGSTSFHFCTRCGTTLWFEPDDASEGVVGIAAGCFADPTFPMPTRVMYAAQRHPSACWSGSPVVHEGAPVSDIASVVGDGPPQQNI